MIEALHTGKMANVSVGGEVSESFSVTNGVKQGCVLPPTLFSIFLSAMLDEDFRDMGDGVYIQSRTDNSILSIPIPLNSICSIPIPHQIDQFQFNSNSNFINSNSDFFLILFWLILFTISRYYEYILGIPTPSSLYSK